MKKWEKTFDIQDIWWKHNGVCGPEDWTDKTVHELGKEIARRLRKKFPLATSEDSDTSDWEIIEILTEFDSISTYPDWVKDVAEAEAEYDADSESVAIAKAWTPLREFNETMASFYDWADENRVWINK